MKIRYFKDTDTLLIELKSGSVAETRDLERLHQRGLARDILHCRKDRA